MKIQNIYQSDDGERLYSMLLEEEEIKIFSKFLEKRYSEDDEKKSSSSATGLALAGAGTLIGVKC